MASPPGYEEKRAFPRIKTHAPVRFQVRGKPEYNNTLCNDISAGGIRLTSSKFIPASEVLMLEISLLERVLKPIGKVVWLSALPHSDSAQMGIQFVEFDSNEKNYLADFIEMQQ